MKKNLSYIDDMHRWGAIWNYSMAGIFLLFPVVLCLIFQVLPDWNGLGQGLIGTMPLFWVVGIIEVITYVPMLGVGGSYLSFVTGNISNLKLPCALDTLDKLGLKATSDEGEVISTISIAVSSITTTAIVLIGVMLMLVTDFASVLETPALQPAFAQTIPALFGALAVVFISKNWKIAIAPMALMLILYIAVPFLNAGVVSVMVPVAALFTLGVSRILYVKGYLTEKKPTFSEHNAKTEEE